MKLSRLMSVLFVLSIVAVPQVFAAEIGVRAGRYNDAEDEFVGVEAAFGNQFQVVPNIEYILTDDDSTALTANLEGCSRTVGLSIAPRRSISLIHWSGWSTALICRAARRFSP